MRFWAGLVAALLLLTVAWCGIFVGQLARPTVSSRWVAEAMTIKRARAAELGGRRKLVVVAGSNALFGLDSARLEKEWGLPVVNGAVNAGLLLPYVLASSRPLIGPGDVVLMPLEYPMFNYDGEINAIVIDYVLARDSAYWRSLSWLDRLRFIAYAEPVRLLRGWQRQLDLPVGQGVYGGHHIDRRGDQTHTAVADQTAQDRAERDASHAWHYGRESRADNRGWTLLRDFHNWLRQRGACLIMQPPTLLYDVSYQHDPVERQFYAMLPERVRTQGISYVGDPYAFMYPREWYFNTDYHLTAEARQRHTERVIAQLGPDLRRWCQAAAMRP